MSKKSIPDEFVLAAIERAQRHRTHDSPGVPIWQVKEHLGLPKHSPHVRRVLSALVQAGVLQPARAHSVELWALTAKGRRRLRSAQGVELPESPQHRAWRDAHTLAQQEIERLRTSLGERITEASILLGDEDAHSDAWFELAERLRRAAWVLGSATHCLREWPEPDEAHPDTDEQTEPGDAQLGEKERGRTPLATKYACSRRTASDGNKASTLIGCSFSLSRSHTLPPASGIKPMHYPEVAGPSPRARDL